MRFCLKTAAVLFAPKSSGDHKDASDKKHRDKEKMKHKDGNKDKHRDKEKRKEVNTVQMQHFGFLDTA